jgi:hypothetical protein
MPGGECGALSQAAAQIRYQSHADDALLYRIEPNRTQSAALSDMLVDFCGLDNAGLQQHIEAYRRRGISVNSGMQADELKAVRLAAPELARWSYSARAHSQDCRRHPRCALPSLA